jgi:hypothetical protein
MFKKLFVLGVVSGVLAGIAAMIYSKLYTSSLGGDFGKIITPASIIAANIFAGVLAAVGYWILHKWLKAKTEIVFNFIFVILSFASIVIPFAAKLPLEWEAPELFPGLTIPMHFFPALAWFTLKPLFVKAEVGGLKSEV